MNLTRQDLTAERLREVLDYDPETGIFMWKEYTPRRHMGKPVGSPNPYGHLIINVDGKHSNAHRLAFLWMKGRWPTNEIDHINGKPADNRWVNLREADRRKNSENQRKARKDNASGLLGVRRDKRNRFKQWYSCITVEGKRKRLGYFGTPEEAHKAYLRAKRELHEGNTI